MRDIEVRVAWENNGKPTDEQPPKPITLYFSLDDYDAECLEWEYGDREYDRVWDMICDKVARKCDDDENFSWFIDGLKIR